MGKNRSSANMAKLCSAATASLVACTLQFVNAAEAQVCRDFLAPIMFSTLPDSEAIHFTLGDFNNDQHLDIAYAGRTSNVPSSPTELHVRLGSGNGTFSDATGYQVGSFSESTAVHIDTEDFDGDGDLDVVLAFAFSNNDNIFIMQNNGLGVFSVSSSFEARQNPSGVHATDIDGDKDIDLAISNALSNDVSLFFNDSGANFALSGHLPVGDQPNDIALCDIDNDGALDIVTSNFKSDNISVLIQDSNGTFLSAVQYTVAVEPHALATGDLNGDTFVDIAVAYEGSIAILLNQADGTFSAPRLLPVQELESNYSLAAVDIDSDGDLDLVKGNLNQAPQSSPLLLNNGDATFIDGPSIGLGRIINGGISAGDLNEDGAIDLVLSQRLSNTNGFNKINVVMNNPMDPGALRVARTYQYSLPTNATTSGTGPMIFDVDGDNSLDVVHIVSDNLPLSRKVYVRKNNGFGILQDELTAYEDTSEYDINCCTYGDIDGDGDLDIVAGLNIAIEIFINDGTGYFVSDGVYSTGNKTFSVQLGDLDLDGDLDVATANQSSHDVSVLTNNGDGTFATTNNYPVGFSPTSLLISDLNDDQSLDIVSGNSWGAPPTVSVLLNKGNAAFGPYNNYHTSNPVRGKLSAGDVDGDGDIDLVTSTGLSFADILRNQGDGSFFLTASYQLGFLANQTDLSLVDVDQDGDLDLLGVITLHNFEGMRVLINNGIGAFTLIPTQYYAGDGTTRWLQTVDIDNDGDLDALTSSQTQLHVNLADCDASPDCYADCDQNGVLNIFDYICYGNAFASSGAYADCDGNGVVDKFDYICFGNAYAAGCP